MAAASLVRGYKSAQGQGPGAGMGPMMLVVADKADLALLQGAAVDLAGLARSPRVRVAPALQPNWVLVSQRDGLGLALSHCQGADIEGIGAVQ